MTSFLLAGEIGAWLDTTFAEFDFGVFEILGNAQSDFLTSLAKVFTAMGEPIYVILVGVICAFFFFNKKTRKIAFTIACAIAIGAILVNLICKPLVARIRPYNTLQDSAQYWSWYVGAGMLSESDFCFPSGHSAAATEISVALFLCHLTSRKKSAKAICWFFPLVAICVGLSRIYLMVHYATDVIGGILFGIIAAVAAYFLSKVACRIFKTEPSEAQLAEGESLRKGLIFALVVSWLIVFCLSYTKVSRTDGLNAIRCEYDEDYDCQNEAADSSKYPPIDGKYYCKIHWRELAK